MPKSIILTQIWAFLLYNAVIILIFLDHLADSLAQMQPIFTIFTTISLPILLYTPFLIEGLRAFQQTKDLWIGAILGAATLAFLILIIAVIWLIGRVAALQTPQPQTVVSAGRPSMVGIDDHYIKLFLALEASLSREEAINMAFALGIDTDEWGEATRKSTIIRETILHMDNRHSVGHIYKWIGQHRPEVTINANY